MHEMELDMSKPDMGDQLSAECALNDIISLPSDSNIISLFLDTERERA